MHEQLKRVTAATVRVNAGSGVVLAATATSARVLLTARHVVADKKQATIQWEGGMRIERVLATDEVADVAFVDVPRELEDRGLELGPCEVAEDVWLLGFPGGWQGNVPLVSRGTIAGIAGRSAWVDGSASWGHSGGPVVALRKEPVVVGDISGAASRVHRELEDLIRVAAEEQDLVERRIEQLAAQRRNVDAALGLAGHATTRVHQALQLIQSHFRAGFIEVATSEAITVFRGT